MVVSILKAKEKFLKTKKLEILENNTKNNYTEIERKMLDLIEIELKLIENEKNEGGKTYVKRDDPRRHSKK